MGFSLPCAIFEKLRVGDGVDIDMSRGSMGSSLVERVVAGGVSSVGEIEIF